MAQQAVTISISGQYSDKDIKRAIRDLQSLQKEAPKAADKTKQMSGATSQLGWSFKSAALSIAAATISIGAVTQAIRSSVESASRLQQSMGATDALFGASSATMDAWAKEAAAALGLSSSDALDAANRFATAGKQMGLVGGELVRFTKDMTAQAADMAAMYGGTVTDAVTALSATFRGEFDPAERYGLALRATAVDAQAAAMGFKKVNGAFSQAAKNAAVTRLITDQNRLNGVIGANAREADTYQGTINRLSSAIENASATIGQQFLQSISDVSSALGGVDGIVSQIGLLGEKVAIIVKGGAGFIKWLTTVRDNLGDRRWEALMRLNEITNPLAHFISGVNDALTQMGTEQMAAERTTNAITLRLQGQADASRDAASASNDNAAALRDLINKADLAKSSVDRLKDSLDALYGNNRNRAQLRLDLQRLRREGPSKSGERTVTVMRDGKPVKEVQRYTTKADAKQFALDYAIKSGQYADTFSSMQRQGDELASAQSFIAGKVRKFGVGRGYVNRLIGAPEYLTNPRPWEQMYAKGFSGGTTINIDKVEVTATTVAEAAEKAKQAARLAALSRTRYAGKSIPVG